VGTKGRRRSGGKGTSKQGGKAGGGGRSTGAGRRPAAAAVRAPAAKAGTAGPAVAAASARRGAAPAVRAAGRADSGPSPLERAKALRDTIQRTKLTAADPWGYTPKARGWVERAESILTQLIADPGSAAGRKALDALATEVEGDRDFQEARRLF
jgi:hypothetical protein